MRKQPGWRKWADFDFFLEIGFMLYRHVRSFNLMLISGL